MSTRWALVVLVSSSLLPACWLMQDTGAWNAGDDSDTDSSTDSSTIHDVPAGHLLWATSLDQGSPYAIAGLDGNTAVIVGYDGFIAHLDQNGELLWEQAMDGPAYDCFQDVTALDGGSFAVSGYFSATAEFGWDGDTLTSAGGRDGVVARFEADGELTWLRQIGGEKDDLAGSVSAAPSGQLAVAGSFEKQAVFGQGEPNETTLGPIYSDDAFVATFDAASGAFGWASRVDSPMDWDWDYPNEYLPVRVGAAANGSFRLTGVLAGPLTFCPDEPWEIALNSGDDVFLASYTADGPVEWAVMEGGGEEDFGRDVDVAPDGTAFVVGHYYGPLTFGAGDPGQTVLGSMGQADAFVASWDTAGQVEWAAYGGSSMRDEAYGVTALADGGVAITGYHRAAAFFGEGQDSETDLPFPDGSGYAAFVAVYNQAGQLAWATTAGGGWRTVGIAVDQAADGDLLVTGYFTGTAVFGQDEPNETALSSGYVFVAKYAL